MFLEPWAVGMWTPSRQRVYKVLILTPPSGPWSSPVTTLTPQVADSGVPLVVPGHLDKIVVFQPCLRIHRVTTFRRG